MHLMQQACGGDTNTSSTHAAASAGRRQPGGHGRGHQPTGTSANSLLNDAGDAHMHPEAHAANAVGAGMRVDSMQLGGVLPHMHGAVMDIPASLQVHGQAQDVSAAQQHLTPGSMVPAAPLVHAPAHGLENGRPGACLAGSGGTLAPPAGVGVQGAAPSTAAPTATHDGGGGMCAGGAAVEQVKENSARHSTSMACVAAAGSATGAAAGSAAGSGQQAAAAAAAGTPDAPCAARQAGMTAAASNASAAAANANGLNALQQQVGQGRETYNAPMAQYLDFSMAAHAAHAGADTSMCDAAFGHVSSAANLLQHLASVVQHTASHARGASSGMHVTHGSAGVTVTQLLWNAGELAMLCCRMQVLLHLEQAKLGSLQGAAGMVRGFESTSLHARWSALVALAERVWTDLQQLQQGR